MTFDCCATADSSEAVGKVGLLSLGFGLTVVSFQLNAGGEEVRSSQEHPVEVGHHGSQCGEADREDQGKKSWLEGGLCRWESFAQVSEWPLLFTSVPFSCWPAANMFCLWVGGWYLF